MTIHRPAVNADGGNDDTTEFEHTQQRVEANTIRCRRKHVLPPRPLTASGIILVCVACIDWGILIESAIVNPHGAMDRATVIHFAFSIVLGVAACIATALWITMWHRNVTTADADRLIADYHERMTRRQDEAEKRMTQRQDDAFAALTDVVLQNGDQQAADTLFHTEQVINGYPGGNIRSFPRARG